jgi:glycosyltransferase involved in cell wall biosynthesis
MSRSQTVSVVVPAFNAAATIRRALDSALIQAGCSLDVIVVDDGSTDATPELLTEYAGRIRVLRQANAGVAAARNAAIEVAHGDFMAFLDADDEWLPAKLEKQLLQFRQGVDIVYCGAFYLTATGVSVKEAPVYLQGDVLPRLMDGNFIPTSSVVARAECFRRPEVRFPSSLRLGEDYAMWVRLALQHRFAVVREPLVRFQVGFHREKYPLLDHERAFDYIERMLAEHLGPTDPRRSAIRHMRASGCWNTAVLEAREGRYLASSRAAFRALRARPFGFRGIFHYLRHGLFVRPGAR